MPMQCKTCRFLLHVVLAALALQAITPDTNSIASNRLLQVLDPILERAKPCVIPYLGCRWLAILTETSRPIADSTPNRTSDEEDAPDEVCVPSSAQADQVTRRKAGDPYPCDRSRHRSPELRNRFDRAIAARSRDRVTWTGASLTRFSVLAAERPARACPVHPPIRGRTTARRATRLQRIEAAIRGRGESLDALVFDKGRATWAGAGLWEVRETITRSVMTTTGPVTLSEAGLRWGPATSV